MIIEIITSKYKRAHFHAIRITRHFAIFSISDGTLWNVSHLPSGGAAISRVPFLDAIELAETLETCGEDWDFTEPEESRDRQVAADIVSEACARIDARDAA